MNGDLLASRYRLGPVLGTGASGEVVEALDLVTQRIVAVKRLVTSDPAHVRLAVREAAVLRALHLPGVVPLLDAGEEDGRPYLVMERILGRPFPGDVAPAPWSAVRGPTFALLDVLERVHRLGFVHRDVKPPNVLVDAVGKVWLLDFGLARATADSNLTQTGGIVGSLRFIAPEVWERAVAGPAADRWAVGVMLWEALTGQVLYPEQRIPALIRAICSAPPPEAPVSLPEEARAVLARLLERDPSRRHVARIDLVAAPWPGPPEDVAVAVSAARTGGRIALAPGADMDALLDAVEAAIHPLHLLRVPAGAAPLESLLALGVPGPEGAEAWFAALHEDVVLAVSQPLDPWSARLLRGTRRRVLWLDRGRSRWTRRRLATLFGGEERVLHEIGDAADAAWARTAGHPVRVAALLVAWCRGGHATVQCGRWVVDRAWLDALAVGADGLADGVDGTDDLVEPARDVLLTLALGRPGLTAGQVATATGLLPWQAGSVLARLAKSGRAVRTPAGWRDVGAACLLGALPTEELRARGAALAASLPDGHPARLRAALLGDEPERVVAEAVVGARRLRCGGRAAAGRALLEAAALVVRVAARPVNAGKLLDELALHALAAERASDASRAAALVRAATGQGAGDTTGSWASPARPGSGDPAPLAPVATLLDAVAAALSGKTREAEQGLVQLGRFSDAVLETWRVSLQVRLDLASGRVDEALATTEAALAADPADPAARARLETLLGLVRYRQGRFGEAAALHARAAHGRAFPDERISSWLNGANALLEAGELGRAERVATRAEQAAERARLAVHVTRAAWTRRAARYRLGELDAPDLPLTRAVSRVGAPALDGLVHLQEAAFAWRAGDLAGTRALAAHAAERCSAAGVGDGALLARALAVACGARGDVGALIVEARRARLPAIAAQALWLLGPPAEEALAERLGEVPEARRGVWLEVVRLPPPSKSRMPG